MSMRGKINLFCPKHDWSMFHCRLEDMKKDLHVGSLPSVEIMKTTLSLVVEVMEKGKSKKT